MLRACELRGALACTMHQGARNCGPRPNVGHERGLRELGAAARQAPGASLLGMGFAARPWQPEDLPRGGDGQQRGGQQGPSRGMGGRRRVLPEVRGWGHGGGGGAAGAGPCMRPPQPPPPPPGFERYWCRVAHQQASPEKTVRRQRRQFFFSYYVFCREFIFVLKQQEKILT